MKRLITAFLATLVVVTTAFAVPSSWQPLLWITQHDGISLDFGTQTYYTKAPGAPARYAAFTDLFTFTRGSTASYIGPGGTMLTASSNVPRIEYISTTAGTNFLLQSQSVDTSWTLSGSTISANAAAAPDGTTTADKIVESSGGTFHLIRQDTALLSIGRVHTFSTYLQAAGRGFSRIQFTDTTESNGCYVDVNLSTGATGTVTAIGTGASQTVTVTTVGSYYRVALSCSISTTAATGRAQILLASALGTVNFSGDGSSGVYTWGNQVEPFSTASQYAVTTTTAPAYVNSNATPAGLLMEVSRQNISARSEELDNAGWTKTGASVTADTGLAPDGTTSTDKIVEDGTTAIHGVIRGVTVTAGGTYTLSAYVRPSGRSFAFLYGINVDQYGAVFDLNNLTTANITSGTGSVTAKGIIPLPNGVYRIWVSGVMNGSATTLNFVGGPAISLTVPAGYTYAGNSSSGIEMWGVQIELGATPTSYISTAAAAVTRSPDVASRTLGAEAINAAGTFVIAGRSSIGREASNQFVMTMGTGGDTILFLRPANSDLARFNVFTSSVAQGPVDSTFTDLTNYRAAFAFATNDLAMSFNGGAVGTDTAASIGTLGTLFLGSENSPTLQGNMHIRTLDYYPVRKPNEFLVKQSTPRP